jgi:hypothetical protein
MTSYFGLWKVETSLQPTDPKLAMQLYMAFQAQVKSYLESGDLKETNSFLEGNEGYFITGDISEEKVHELLLNFTPFLTFQVHKTVPVTQTLEKLIGIAKQRATMMGIPA